MLFRISVDKRRYRWKIYKNSKNCSLESEYQYELKKYYSLKTELLQALVSMHGTEFVTMYEENKSF